MDTIDTWTPDDNPLQARRIGKTLEEINELGAVLARISIQGLYAIDPNTGKLNGQRLLEEVADVRAQLICTEKVLKLNQNYLQKRTEEKVALMTQWEAHLLPK